MIEDAIPVVIVEWLNPVTSAGFEPVASSDLFGTVTTRLIAPLLTTFSVAFSLYVCALRQKKSMLRCHPTLDTYQNLLMADLIERSGCCLYVDTEDGSYCQVNP